MTLADDASSDSARTKRLVKLGAIGLSGVDGPGLGSVGQEGGPQGLFGIALGGSRFGNLRS